MLNEEKSFTALRFFKSLENQIYKYLTPVGKKFDFDKLDSNISCDSVSPDTFIKNISNIIKKTKVQINDHGRTPEYKNILAKSYVFSYVFNNNVL